MNWHGLIKEELRAKIHILEENYRLAGERLYYLEKFLKDKLDYTAIFCQVCNKASIEEENNKLFECSECLSYFCKHHMSDEELLVCYSCHK